MSSNPDSATKNPVCSGAINDDVPTRTGYAHLKNTTEVGRAQLEATLGTSAIKQEAAEHGRTTKETKTTTSRSSAVKTKTASEPEAGSKSATKKGSSKRPPSRRSSSRKGEKEDANPPSSDPDDSDSSSPDVSAGCSSSSGFSSSSSDDMDLARDFRADNDHQGLSDLVGLGARS